MKRKKTKKVFETNTQLDAMKKVRKTWAIDPTSRPIDGTTRKGKKPYNRRDAKRIDEEPI